MECDENGRFILSKPVGTGGLVSRGSVAEQVYLSHSGMPHHLPFFFL